MVLESIRHRSHLEGQAAPSSTPSVPSTLHIRTLAVCAVEVVHGIRPIEQLARHVNGDVLDRILQQRTLRQERSQVYADTRRIVPHPGRVVSSMPHQDKLHAAVVLHSNERSFAVVLRLERIESRWRATELTIM